MSDDKPEANTAPPPIGERGSGGMYVWGILAGALIAGLIFYKQVLGLLKDAFTNILPIFFSPGLLEISLGLTGFGLVILVNYLLSRREQADEWVELPDDEE